MLFRDLSQTLVASPVSFWSKQMTKFDAILFLGSQQSEAISGVGNTEQIEVSVRIGPAFHVVDDFRDIRVVGLAIF